MPGWVPSGCVLYGLSYCLLSTASFRDVLPGRVLNALGAQPQEEARCSTSWLWDNNSSTHKLRKIKQADVKLRNMHFPSIPPPSCPHSFKKPMACRVGWTWHRSWLPHLNCVSLSNHTSLHLHFLICIMGIRVPGSGVALMQVEVFLHLHAVPIMLESCPFPILYPPAAQITSSHWGVCLLGSTWAPDLSLPTQILLSLFILVN